MLSILVLRSIFLYITEYFILYILLIREGKQLFLLPENQRSYLYPMAYSYTSYTLVMKTFSILLYGTYEDVTRLESFQVQFTRKF